MHAPEENRLRVLFLAEGDPEDADASASGAAARLIRALRDLGHTVIAADVELTGLKRLIGAASVFHSDRTAWSAKFHLHPRLFRMRSANAARIVRASADKVDAVLQYGNGFYAAGLMPTVVWADTAAKLTLGTPFSWIDSIAPKLRAEVFACEERVWQHAHRILTFSQLARSRFTSELGIPNDKVVVGGTGPFADVEDLDGLADQRRSRRQADHIPTILMVGREWERKGGPDLVKAFGIVREKLPQARLVVVGPSSNPGLPDGVEFVGYLSRTDPVERRRLVQLYASADVLCFPSLREPFGVALVEGMYAALPIVATRVEAIPEIVDEDVTGFLVPAHDHEALAERLTYLLSNPDVANRMGNAGLARALTKFTWTKAAETFSSAIRDAIQAHRSLH